MSEWVSYVKTYAETHNVPYKQALKMHHHHIKREMKRK